MVDMELKGQAWKQREHRRSDPQAMGKEEWGVGGRRLTRSAQYPAQLP